MANNLSLYVPSPSGVERLDRRTSDVVKYLTRVASTYPEGTLAIFYTGTGTRQYRKHYRGKWELIRQTVGP
jgi:hypothetical protein